MTFRFAKDIIEKGKAEKRMIFAVEVRHHGKPKLGERGDRIAVQGVADDANGPIVEAMLKWLVKRDEESRDELIAGLHVLESEKVT